MKQEILTSSFILRILYGYPLTGLLTNDKISAKNPFLLFPLFLPVLAPSMVPFLYNNETFLSLNCSWVLYPSQDHRGVVETIPAAHGWRQVHPWVTPQLIAVCIRGFSPLLKGTSPIPFMFWSHWPTSDQLLMFWLNTENEPQCTWLIEVISHKVEISDFSDFILETCLRYWRSYGCP